MESAQRLITVSGSGTVDATPDIASVELAVEVMAQSVDQAFSRNAALLDAVAEAVIGAGVAAADIATTGRELRAERRWRDGHDDGLLGYVARGTMRLTLRALPEVAGVLQAAVAGGGDDVRLERFSLSVSDPQAAARQARDAAWADARAKAEQLAFAAGATLGPVVSISEGDSMPGPAPILTRMAAKSTPGDIHAGSQSVSVTLQLQWELQAQ